MERRFSIGWWRHWKHSGAKQQAHRVGLCRVAPESLAEFDAFKKRTGTRVFAVLVDVDSSAEVPVQQRADQVHRVVDLLRDAQAAQDAAVAVFGAV